MDPMRIIFVKLKIQRFEWHRVSSDLHRIKLMINSKNLKKKEFANLILTRAKSVLVIEFASPSAFATIYQLVDIVSDLEELVIKQLASEAAQPDSGRTDVRLMNAWLY